MWIVEYFNWLCPKSPCSGISLCNLCVLCVSVVWFYSEFINHRDTEDTEIAQRNQTFRAKPLQLLTRELPEKITMGLDDCTVASMVFEFDSVDQDATGGLECRERLSFFYLKLVS